MILFADFLPSGKADMISRSPHPFFSFQFPYYQMHPSSLPSQQALFNLVMLYHMGIFIDMEKHTKANHLILVYRNKYKNICIY